MEEELFSSIDLVSQCLIDEEKTSAFDKSIRRQIKSNFEVLDIGTGSGILSLLAARAGANHVTALEFDPYIAEIAKNNIKQNHFENVVKVCVGDARTYDYERKSPFDMVLMEMLSTGMVDEYQVQASNNLHSRKLISPSTILLPNKQMTYVTLSEFDFTVGGFEMKMVRHLWNHNENRNLLDLKSFPTLLSNIDFSALIEEKGKYSIECEATKSGKINSIYFTSKTILSETISLDDTSSLNAPVVIPIPEKIVKIGEKIKLEIKYKFGGGYENFTVEFD
ncbi:MAG: 50S ribosomal protein L11 methyltransferase [Candidatus Taylorbacteria bacterium]